MQKKNIEIVTTCNRAPNKVQSDNFKTKGMRLKISVAFFPRKPQLTIDTKLIISVLFRSLMQQENMNRMRSKYKICIYFNFFFLSYFAGRGRYFICTKRTQRTRTKYTRKQQTKKNCYEFFFVINLFLANFVCF